MENATAYFVCYACNAPFRSQKALGAHHGRKPACSRDHFHLLQSRRQRPNVSSHRDTAAHESPPHQPPPPSDDSQDFPLDDTSPSPTANGTPPLDHISALDPSWSHHPINVQEPLASQVRLLHLLNDINAPHHAFTDIWNWASSLAVMPLETRTSLHSAPRQRNGVISSLSKLYSLDKCAPATEIIELPSGHKVKLVTHDFKAQLFSLLSDPKLMEEKNLLLRPDANGGPFGPPNMPPFSPEYVMQDIDDGSVYRQAYIAHIKHPERDLLVPIIFFLDKTHCDANGHLTLEPLSFTLGIFTKEARKNPAFWRCLGYVYNSSRILSPQTPEQKQTDYHHALKHIMASFVQAQKEDGISWKINYHGKLHDVVMKIPLLFITGDTEGHDKLCGKFTSRINVKFLCRVCCCPYDKTSDPSSTFPHTKASKISTLVRKAGSTTNIHHQNRYREQLRSMSYYCLPNALTEVIWCDPSRGVNGSTPPELLHVIQQGLIPYKIDGLFGVRRQLKSTMTITKRKRAPEEAAGPSTEPPGNAAPPVESDHQDTLLSQLVEGQKEAASTQSVNSVFTESEKSRINGLAMIYGRRLVHQSCRDWQYATFADGISNNSRKNGHEQRCVVLLLLLIFCSKEGKRYEELMSPSILSNYIVVQSFLLLFEDFHRVDSFPRKFVSRIKKFVPLFLQYYKNAINRTDGVGMNFVKFHLPLHWWEDLERFGPASSYDSSHGESMHREFKADATRTARNGETFEEAVGKRHHERTVVRRSRAMLKADKGSLTALESLHDSSTGPCIVRGNFCVYASGCFRSPLPKKPRKEWHDTKLMKSVEDYIGRIIRPTTGESPIRLFKQCTVNGNLYRADPLYQPDVSTKFGWHDWVHVHWSEWGEDTIPSRIMTFLELVVPPGNQLHDPLVDGATYSESGIYALVHALPEALNQDPQDARADGDNYLSHQCSRLVYKSGICVNPDKGTPELYLVHVASMFKGVCVAVPFDPTNTDGTEFLLLQPRHKWKDVLYNWSGELLAQSEHEQPSNST